MMLSVQCDQPVNASFPSVHAFIMLEGTMNLTGETQPLVEQLMMIKRMQVYIYLVKNKILNVPEFFLPGDSVSGNTWFTTFSCIRIIFYIQLKHIYIFSCFVYSVKLSLPPQKIPNALFVLEIWKACFTGLIESPEGTEELKWTAFTFLKVNYTLVYLKYINMCFSMYTSN